MHDGTEIQINDSFLFFSSAWLNAGTGLGNLESYSPPPSDKKGPWWKEMLASPVKRFRLSGWSSPRKDQPPTLELPPPKMEIPSLQVTKEAENTELEKAGLFNRTPKVLRFTAMTSPQESAGSLEPSTTGGVRWALRRTKHSATGRWRISWPLTTPTPQWLQRTPAQDRMVSKLLSAAHLDFPLTPLHIKTVAGALKEAGYKSTFSYGT